MNSLLQAISDYTGVAIQIDYISKTTGKEDVHTAGSFVPAKAAPAAAPAAPAAPAAAPDTEEASTNTEPVIVGVSKEHVHSLELRIQYLEKQVKDILILLDSLERTR